MKFDWVRFISVEALQRVACFVLRRLTEHATRNTGTFPNSFEMHPIRLSKSDPDVYLFYKAEKTQRWICVVAKDATGSGFVITTYPTGAIKEGELIWQK